MLTAVQDSATYLVYTYRVINSGASTSGAAVLSLDLAAPSGTGFPILASTGKFVHGPGIRGVNGARDHVPVGPISPPNWQSFLKKDASLDWFGAHGGFEGDIDSIAPGDSLDGFGLRSPYLPGLRQSWAAPTFRSCCTGLRPGSQSSEPENPNPKEFRIIGTTVGPAVRPDNITVEMLRADLDQVCGALHWIADGAVCGTLHAKLASATPDWRGFLDTLEAQHGAGKPVNDNAYWLLEVNAKFLFARS